MTYMNNILSEDLIVGTRLVRAIRLASVIRSWLVGDRAAKFRQTACLAKPWSSMVFTQSIT